MIKTRVVKETNPSNMKRFINTNNTYYIFLGSVILVLLVVILMLPNINTKYISKTFMLKYSGIDKPIHFIEYIFIFCAFYFLTSLMPLKFSIRKRAAIAIFFSLLISISDEVYQIFRAQRSFEYADLLANTTGIVAGLTIVFSKKTTVLVTVSILAILLGIVSLLTIDSHLKIKHYYKGLEYEKTNELQKAKNEYLLAVKAGNTNASLYNSIAWLDIEFLNTDPQVAYKYAGKAVSIKPNNPDYLDTYGWVLLHLNRPKEAITFLKKAFELKPQISSIHLHLGASYYAIGEYEKSLYHLQKQIELKSDNRYAMESKEIIEKIKKK